MRPEAHTVLFAQYLFRGGFLCGNIFVTLFVGIVADKHKSLDEIKLLSSTNNVQLLSEIAILEILTVCVLFSLDFVLSMQVLNTYVNGVGLLQMAQSIENDTYRMIMTVLLGGGHNCVVLYGILWIRTMLG